MKISRMHVHVVSGDGGAKCWIEPDIELAQNYALSERDLLAVKALIKEHEDGIRSAWRQHFGS